VDRGGTGVAVASLQGHEFLWVIKIDQMGDAAVPERVQVELRRQPGGVPGLGDAVFSPRDDIRLARSVTNNAGNCPGENSGRTSVTQWSSTSTIQSISGTVKMVRRLGGLPLEALP
jgi:hypothetical protein